eukprot:comp16870_c0_seq1/m.15354 comp16870_c0_seq1/g.15354  ORF comp16870_c0_seq1/g.15354 comp16870_c0_seq1/m.15354 type:complete len:312 (-) comp16870_c0_seq1:269-1204(-)
MERDVRGTADGSDSSPRDGCSLSETERHIRNKDVTQATPPFQPPTHPRRSTTFPFTQQHRHTLSRKRREHRTDAKKSAPPGTFHIRVKSSMGLACRVRVCDTDKAAAVVLTVSSFIGIPASRIHLVLKKTGQELTNGSLAMRDLGVVDGDLLHLLPKIRAGPLGGYPHACVAVPADSPDLSAGGSSKSGSKGYSSEEQEETEDGNAQLEGHMFLGHHSLAKRLRKLDEAQVELDNVSLGGEEESGDDDDEKFGGDVEREREIHCADEVDEVAEDGENGKEEEHDRTRKRMLEIRERMLAQKNAKRRKLCPV